MLKKWDKTTGGFGLPFFRGRCYVVGLNRLGA
jgi:hypothetical protein